MKGVMDHADKFKSDNMKAFAAKASAECLIAFLRQNMQLDAQKIPPPAELGISQGTSAFEGITREEQHALELADALPLKLEDVAQSSELERSL